MYLFLVIFFAVFAACLITIAIASNSLAPWIPTRKRDLKRIFRLANLKPNEIFYDLGCGDGKVVIFANKNFKAKAIGIELALPLFLICKIRQLFIRDKDLIFHYKNLFKENLSKADVVYLFAESANKLKGEIKQKLEKELKPGARVISYAFAFTDWTPEIIDKPSKNDIVIYLYKF